MVSARAIAISIFVWCTAPGAQAGLCGRALIKGILGDLNRFAQIAVSYPKARRATRELMRRVEHPSEFRILDKVENVGKHRILEVKEPVRDWHDFPYVDPRSYKPLPGTDAELFPNHHPRFLHGNGQYIVDKFGKFWLVDTVDLSRGLASVIRKLADGTYSAKLLQVQDYSPIVAERAYITDVEISTRPGVKHNIRCIDPGRHLNWGEAHAQRLRTALKSKAKALVAALPLSVVESTNQIVLYPRQMSSTWLDFYRANTSAEIHDIAGLGGLGTVHVFPSGMNSQSILGIIDHELGHNLAKAVWNDTDPGRVWRRAVELNQASVSTYGDTNLAEDFAETVRIYLDRTDSEQSAQDRLKFAPRFAVLDALFDPDRPLNHRQAVSTILGNYHRLLASERFLDDKIYALTVVFLASGAIGISIFSPNPE